MTVTINSYEGAKSSPNTWPVGFKSIIIPVLDRDETVYNAIGAYKPEFYILTLLPDVVMVTK